MKVTFFSVFALALSAIASPVPQVNKAVGSVGQVKDVVKSATDIFTKKVGARQVADEATASKRAITDPQVLITTLKTAVHKVNGQTTGIYAIVEKVKTGAITKEAAANQVVPLFKAVHVELTVVVTKLTGAVGINVAGVDVDTVLHLVVALVSGVLTTVKTVVDVIGLQPQLIAILQSVIQIVANVLTLVIGLVSAIVPGLIAALTPILSGVNALLAPILTPVTIFLAGISI
ncbi:hypothetical protein N0V84_004205 [Fusarium piperis]|uniref:Uncharacterized protein n=1 Tax=Fusarium piperis TaxID=1435070 RepID=A0A9W8WGA5_9HYPO|nr:hypothetical protein N0V84_004205 [Fusarium piperis]